MLFCLLKTFFFLRIVKSFSYVVTMIRAVSIDLKVFMIFFFVLIIMFSMVRDIIAPNNQPAYRYVGQFTGNFITTFR